MGAGFSAFSAATHLRRQEKIERKDREKKENENARNEAGVIRQFGWLKTNQPL
jgi:hypothetical protein